VDVFEKTARADTPQRARARAADACAVPRCARGGLASASPQVLDSPVVHQWLVTALRFMPDEPDYVFSAAVDGLVCKARALTWHGRLRA
jgi:hypothetical protein